eukprot:jgi/Orpsp1_1/1174453/evm.model.c7180000050154.1
MLNQFILGFLFIVSYFGSSLQNNINSSNVISYVYQEKSCQFNVLSTTEELNNNIKQCDDIILKELSKNEDKNNINFHGKIHISSTVFERISLKDFGEKDIEEIISQISTLLNNYRNHIFSWDIYDDLIISNEVSEWIDKLSSDEKEVYRSPIILNEENPYFNPYYDLLKRIMVMGIGVDKRITMNYQQSINLSKFNYDEDIQKLSIIYQMIHRLLDEMVPVTSLQFNFDSIFSEVKKNDKDENTKEEKNMDSKAISESIYHFISNLKMFSNLKTNIVFNIPNNKEVQNIEFDRFIQKCHKNNIQCKFSLIESIHNYKSIISYNLYDNDYNSNMSSYFNSTMNIINSKFYKRDTVNSVPFNITYYMKSDSEDNQSANSEVYDYAIDLYKFPELQELSYNSMYEYDKISIKRTDDIFESSKNKTSINFFVIIDTKDNGDRTANYLFNAVALYIFVKKEEEQNRDIEIVISVKNSREPKDEMCQGTNSQVHDPTCPDLALLTSNDISVYYQKSKLTSLDKFIREYYKDYGITLESKIYKYAFYDYHIDNQWMAIPFTVQIRTLLFNSTTFENCKLFDKENELHLPPPYHEYWDSSSEETTWDWKHFFNYARIIKECTGGTYPGITFFGDNYEELKFLSMYVQSVGIPFIIEDDKKIKRFATEKQIDFADRFDILDEALKNGYINEWIDPESIENWRSKPYSNYYEDVEKIIFKKKSDEEILKLYSDEPTIIGMAIANPEKMEKYFDNEKSPIKHG